MSSMRNIILMLYLSAIANMATRGQTSASPNGRYEATVKFDKSEQIETIDVTSQDSKKLLFETKSLPVVRMKWSTVSNFLLIYGHLAGGSDLKVITQKDGKWLRIDCDPPLDDLEDANMHYGVVEVIELGSEGKFRVSYLLGIRGTPKYYVIKYDLSLLDNKISNIKKQQISTEERDAIKTVGQE
jgi:hypothetical protein